MNLAALHMIPVDRHFQRPESELLRQIKNLDVEAEAVHLLLSEDGLRSLTTKRLEAALGITQRQSRKNPDERVEHLAIEFPKSGLVYANPVTPQRAGADDYVPTL